MNQKVLFWIRPVTYVLAVGPGACLVQPGSIQVGFSLLCQNQQFIREWSNAIGKQRLQDNMIIQTQTVEALGRVSYYALNLYRNQGTGMSLKYPRLRGDEKYPSQNGLNFQQMQRHLSWELVVGNHLLNVRLNSHSNNFVLICEEINSKMESYEPRSIEFQTVGWASKLVKQLLQVVECHGQVVDRNSNIFVASGVWLCLAGCESRLTKAIK